MMSGLLSLASPPPPADQRHQVLDLNAKKRATLLLIPLQRFVLDLAVRRRVSPRVYFFRGFSRKSPLLTSEAIALCTASLPINARVTLVSRVVSSDALRS